MRKKTTEQLRRELLVGRSRFNRGLDRKSREYSLERSRASVNNLFSGKVIQAPDVLSIYEFSAGEDGGNFDETIRFCEKLEGELSSGPCVVDFRETWRVSAAALVIICAAVDCCDVSPSWRSTLLWSDVSPAVNRALERTRIADKIKGKKFNYDFSGAKHIPIVSSSGNKHMDDILDFIQNCVYKNKMLPEVEYKYGDAVSETINNVGLHAYPGRVSGQKKWWLLCNVIGDQLYLAIYDRGVGIPKTVLEKPWLLASMEKEFPDKYEEIKKEFPDFENMGLNLFVTKKLTDPQLIYLSMLGDVSGTKKDKHGQGSKSIKALVDETDDGKLWIFSNKGLYKFSLEEDGAEMYRLPNKMLGTLVQWNIKIS